MLQPVHGCYKKVVDVFAILLVLKFHRHKSDRLEVVLFANSVTESVPNFCTDFRDWIVCLS
jgi:hypothetical protein